MLTIPKKQMQAIAQASPGTQMVVACRNKDTFIEIRLVDNQKKPVPKAKYRIQLPDSSILEGELDDDGVARVDHIVPGQCLVSFPEIDGREWRPA
ncbi:MAG: hypothetical protein K2X35_21935 [Bryobacteraceae bacterium]|nr:hypothetical protein [Bryobacteraceae bacterium]